MRIKLAYIALICIIIERTSLHAAVTSMILGKTLITYISATRQKRLSNFVSFYLQSIIHTASCLNPRKRKCGSEQLLVPCILSESCLFEN